MRKKVLSLALCLLMFLGTLPITSQDVSAADAKKCLTIKKGVVIKCDPKASGSLVVPKGVTKIGTNAFSECKKLTSISLQDGVKTIASDAFYNCTSLKSVKLPSSLTTIDDWAFIGCNSLTSITLPKKVSTLGELIFPESDKFKNIYVNSSNSYFSAVNGVLLDKKQTRLIKYPSGKTDKSYKVPSSVTTIDSYAFYRNTYLTSVVLPSKLTTIKKESFGNCNKLKSINFPVTLTTIEKSAFCFTNLNELKLPQKLKTIGDEAFMFSPIEKISIDNGNEYFSVTGGVLFNKKKTKLVLYPSANTNTSYTVPTSVTTIGNNALNNTKLTKIVLPKKLTKIEPGAFSSNSKLTSINIPGAIDAIPEMAFCGCKELKSIVLPSSLTSIRFEAFGFCNKLESIVIPSKVNEIQAWAFISCPKLKKITIKTTKLTSAMGSDVFAQGYKTPKVYVPKKVLSTYKKLFISRGLSEKATFIGK